MAINRFFKPVDYEYTPIPFQELVTLGKYYADERKQAEKDLATYIQKANEFTSLISKDVDTYNKTAFNPQIKQYIEQAASNPSVMKDMGWRSGLQAAVNSVDYGMLNKLKSSAESAKVYNAAVQKLAIEGKMPPGWEPNYFDTYSTADSGVFNATPLAWQSKNDIVHEYVDNLKPGYIDTKNGYDIYGVSEERTLAQVNAAESEIMNLPVIQRNLEKRTTMYQKMGMSDEDAFMKAYSEEWGEIQNEAREKAWFDRRENKYSLLQKQAELAGKDQPSNVNTRIAEHQSLSNNKLIARYSKELDDLTAIKKVNNDIKFKDLSKQEQEEILQDLVKNIKSRGITKDDLTPVNPTEYYNWSGAKVGKEWTNGMAVTDKDGNSLGSDKEGEVYNYRPGDTVYTVDGKIVPSINASFMTGKNQNVVLSDILFEIKNNALYNMSGNVHPYNYGEGPNIMQTDGYLYVSEKALDDAIETVLPGKGSQFRKMLNTMYKVVEEVDGQINGDDVYRIRVGRGFGDIATWNASHNRNYIGDAAGSSTVAKNYSNITGSSWVEAGDY